MKELKTLVDAMPNTLLKANLLTVISAHLNGQMAERHLAELLQEFCCNQLAALRA